MVKSNILNKSSSHGKYLKKSSPFGEVKYLKQILLSWQISETNILLIVKFNI